jgi:hypothetical protein
MSENELTLLYSSGPNTSFMYPLLPDILSLCASKVLTKVNPEAAMGHIHYGQKEILHATAKLQLAVTVNLSVQQQNTSTLVIKTMYFIHLFIFQDEIFKNVLHESHVLGKT